MDTSFGITEEHVDGVPVVTVKGETDVGTAPQLRTCLRNLVEAGHPSLVVDLRPVTFLDSTALGVLIGARRRCREAGGDLRLVIDSPRVIKVFALTGLTSVFETASTLEAVGA